LIDYFLYYFIFLKPYVTTIRNTMIIEISAFIVLILIVKAM